MKRKDGTYKLLRVRVNEPIIAVFGRKKATDYFPNNISNPAPLTKNNGKTNAKGYALTRIVKKTAKQTKMLGRY